MGAWSIADRFHISQAEEAESYALGVQSETLEPEDEFAKQLEISKLPR